MATAALGAQDASQPSPYQGVSTPPPDDMITVNDAPQAKPPAGHPAVAAAQQRPVQTQFQPVAVNPVVANHAVSSSDPDAGIVQVEQSTATSEQPGLTTRNHVVDPDGDIVHPQPLRPGELGEGAIIRVRLLDGLSTTGSERGEAFRSRVASDVLQDGQVLIPAGAEIDGRVADVSSGHAGGRGSMRLQPETVILPNGSRYTLRAEVTDTPGSGTRVGGEGEIMAGSRLKRDGLEYGGAVGGGAIAGAMIAGPVGALTGGLIGAGVVTAHLLIDHPQATLEPGTVLVFSLSESLLMAPEGAGGNQGIPYAR
jgi:hypothetical protein